MTQYNMVVSTTITTMVELIKSSNCVLERSKTQSDINDDNGVVLHLLWSGRIKW